MQSYYIRGMKLIIPLGSRVLVKRLTVSERQTQSGLVIPERGAQPTYKCEVVGIGEEVSQPVKVGNVVLTTPHSGDAVTEGQDTYYLVEGADLLAVIHGDEG